MNRLEKHLEIVLDKICFQGCSFVRKCLNNSQYFKSIPELNTINQSDQLILLQELKSIMDIYDMQ